MWAGLEAGFCGAAFALFVSSVLSTFMSGFSCFTTTSSSEKENNIFETNEGSAYLTVFKTQESSLYYAANNRVIQSSELCQLSLSEIKVYTERIEGYKLV